MIILHPKQRLSDENVPWILIRAEKIGLGVVESLLGFKPACVNCVLRGTEELLVLVDTIDEL